MIQTVQPQTISPVDILWTLFKSQTKKVQREFAELVVQSTNAAILTPDLAKRAVEVENARTKGETVAFSSVEELDSYLGNYEV